MSFDYEDYTGIGGNRYEYNYNRGDNKSLIYTNRNIENRKVNVINIDQLTNDYRLDRFKQVTIDGHRLSLPEPIDIKINGNKSNVYHSTETLDEYAKNYKTEKK